MPGISQTVTRRPLPASLSHLLNWSQTFFFLNYKLVTCFQTLPAASYFNLYQMPRVYLKATTKLASNYHSLGLKLFSKKGRWGWRDSSFRRLEVLPRPPSAPSVPRFSLLLVPLGSSGTRGFRVVFWNSSTMRPGGC